MANANNKSPQAGAACGRVTWPFREEIRGIINAPTRMNSPWKTTSMVERLGVGEFDMGGLPVILVGVRHTRIHGKKGERPCSFFFMPKTPRYQMQNRASTVWCAEFHGATVEDFLEVFGGKNCVIQGCFNHGGRGVQLWNSFRYLEFSCAVCAAMDRGDENGGISEDVGNHYIRAVALMTGWFIHQAGMTAKTARPAEFVQRDAMGTTVSTEWQLGLARFLNEGPDSVQGSSGPRRSRSQVASKGGHYSCLMGSCGHGCGTPHCDADVCMQCTMLSMVWEGCEKRASIESAMRAPTPTPCHGTCYRGCTLVLTSVCLTRLLRQR